MARGHQKEQSREKAAKRKSDTAKGKGTDQRKAAAAALHFTCTVCRIQVPDPKTYKQHFESKHPKSPLPAECLEVEG